MQRGFGFIDVIVGTALLLIVFFGLFGAYRLGLKVVGQSKNKVMATAIAVGEIERARNLSYDQVGIEGSAIVPGTLAASSTVTLNNVQYTVERKVEYGIDGADGIAQPEDSCPNDYKKVLITVSWKGLFTGKVEMATDVAPKNLAQECSQTGGILSVLVFDAYGIPVSSPLIEIKDAISDTTITSATPTTGQHYFALPENTYKVVVTKTGYSSERTYGLGENGIVAPEKPNPIVLQGQLTQTSFSIDRLSSFGVDTLSPWGQEFFSDSFDDLSKVSEYSEVFATSSKIVLATAPGSGYLFSIPISPQNLISWDEFLFNDLEPLNTAITYQLYYYASPDWLLIPDAALPGNSVGFGTSPVDLSSLDPAIYSKLKVRADLSSSATTTPAIDSWQISWFTFLPTPIQNVNFHLRGQKVIGYDASEQPVYKYFQDHTSGPTGHIDITGLEWDSYIFSIDPATGLDLVNSNPSPQPISLAPNSNLSVQLFLDAQNSLLVSVQDSQTLAPVFSASVRLSNAGLGYNTTQYTNERGQTLFIPLAAAIYNLEVVASGYQATSTSLSVSGDRTTVINLLQVE